MRSGSTRAFLAILFVVVTVTLTSLGRSNAAFYAAKGNPGNAFTAGSGFGVGALYEWGDAGDAYTSPTQIFTANTWSRIAVGSHDNCGIQTDNSLWCFGQTNSYGQLGLNDTAVHYLPAKVTGTGWTQVALGNVHTCGIQSDSTLWCWGYNVDGRLGVGTTTNSSVPKQVTSPSATGWATVSTGGNFTCATRTDSTLYCFGLNTSGQLGNTTLTSPQLTGTQVTTPATTGWVSVSAGNQHACAVRTDQSLYCWGDGNGYKLGQGSTTTDSPTPLAVTGTWSSVSAGYDHTCGIRTTGNLYCWGTGTYGRLGSGGTTSLGTPTQVTGGGTNWRAVTAGYAHTCATQTTGTLWCWGYNQWGQVGSGDTVNKTVPTQAGTDTTWGYLSPGSYPSQDCAVRTDGTLWCWGDPGVVRYTTKQVGTDTTWKQLSAGDNFTCGVQTAGTLWCWGINSNYRLGLGDTTFRAVMTKVGTATNWKQVAAGANHACAVTTDTQIWCWGYNTDGQLGNGGTSTVTTPAQITAPFSSGWASVSASFKNTCAVRIDSTLYCWGANTYGQVGQGNVVTPQSTPLPVSTPAATGWAAVQVGQQHTCALRTDKTMYCWGDGASGKLGQGNTTTSSTPLVVPGGAVWSSVATGQSHTCAIKLNGTMWCWGVGSSGQLGQGTTSSSTSPVQVYGTLITWRLVTAGTLMTCAVRIDSTVWCWGSNAAGQTGLGTAVTTQTSPAQLTGLSGRPIAAGPASGAGTVIVS